MNKNKTLCGFNILIIILEYVGIGGKYIWKVWVGVCPEKDCILFENIMSVITPD